MSTDAVAIQSVTKTFGQQKALDEVSFTIPFGGVFGLLGPNGAGKTTLFSLIAGFLKPSGGRIRVLDIDVENISDLRGRLSILPQDARFAANVPIAEQLVFFAQLSGRSRRDAVAEADKALDLVGLGDVAKKSARTLSHGMYKRLGIAQAFLCDPEVILLDEPTSGLDPASAATMRELIEGLRTSATLIVSSHDLAEIQKMCDMVAILDQGRLVERSSVKDITQAESIQRIRFARALRDEEIAAVTAVAGVTSLEAESPTSYRLSVETGERTREDITAEVVKVLAASGAVPKSIEEGVDLESRFLEVTSAPMKSPNASERGA